MIEMEGLEERGKGTVMREWEEIEQYWRGGGRALRAKREREWDRMGWEEWELRYEEGMKTGGDDEGKCGVGDEGVAAKSDAGGRVEGGGGDVSDEMAANDNSGGIVEGRNEDVRGNEGRVEGETLPVGSLPLKRKPLKGKRRGGRKGKDEVEDRRLANHMSMWLCKTRPKDTTTTLEG